MVLKITKVHQKRGVGCPDFVENPLLDLWQVPHSVEAWGAKSQIWLYKMGTPNPPRSFFGIIELKRKKVEGADATNRKEELKRKEKRNEQDIRVNTKGSNKWKRRVEMKERTQRTERKS